MSDSLFGDGKDQAASKTELRLQERAGLPKVERSYTAEKKACVRGDREA